MSAVKIKTKFLPWRRPLQMWVLLLLILLEWDNNRKCDELDFYTSERYYIWTCLILSTLLINCFLRTVCTQASASWATKQITVLWLLARQCAACHVKMRFSDGLSWKYMASFSPCSDESVRTVMKLFFQRVRNGRKKGKSIVISWS